jgi:hypothetical protein
MATRAAWRTRPGAALSLALTMRGGAQNPCVLDCAFPPEPEPCGADANGGCNATPPVFGAITPGQTVCGTVWADAGVRDTDWYQFTLEGPLAVVLTLTSQLPVTTLIVAGVDTCDAVVVGQVGVSDACTAFAPAAASLSAGTYVAFAATGDADSGTFEGFPCSGLPGAEGNRYRLTLLAEGDPPAPPPPAQPFHTVSPVDSAAADGDDGFDSRVTHFTFDLVVVTLTPSGEATWSSTVAGLEASAPGVEVFQHPSGPADGSPPDAGLFGDFPSLEFDTYVTLPAAIGPGQSGLDPMIASSSSTPTSFSAHWFADQPEIEFGTIMRFTLIVPEGALPVVVPAGTEGDLPVLGAIAGETTAALLPDPMPFAFTIVNGAPIDFVLAQVIEAAGEPVIETIGDLTGEGDPDVVTVIPGAILDDAGSLQVFLNQGTAPGPGAPWLGFVSNKPIDAGGDPRGAALAFVDGDNLLDLAVARGGGSVLVFINDGTGMGTFFPRSSFPWEASPMRSPPPTSTSTALTTWRSAMPRRARWPSSRAMATGTSAPEP